MEYTEVKIFTTSAGIQLVTDMLTDSGLDGFVIEDGADIEELLQTKEQYWWDYVDESVLALKDNEPSVTLYIEKDGQTESKIEGIKAALAELREAGQSGENPSRRVDATNGGGAAATDAKGLGRLEVETKTVCDEDWKDKWKEHFKPVHITEKIVIKPTWEAYQAANAGEVIIEIDPGMAFGTGAHPTTSMCVRLLEKYIGEKKTVLDVGCGSGILSIAAALLGAGQVTAVDIDPLAVQVTAENAALNNVSEQITVDQGDLTKGLSVQADIVLANLMAELVMFLSGDVKKHMIPGGIFISSGILTEKQEKVEQALRQNGFTVLESLTEDGWCALVAKVENE